MNIPYAKKIDKIVKFGKDKVFKEMKDPYFWLRNKDDENVINYLNENNEYTEEIMKDTKSQQNIFFNEVKNFILDYESLSIPIFSWDDEYYYYHKMKKEDKYKSRYRINRNTKKEELLIDEGELAKGQTNFDLSGFEIHKSQNIMSYGIDLKGKELYDVKIIKIDTREEIENDIPSLLYCNFFWDDDDIF